MVASKAYTEIKYGKMSLSFAFLAIIFLAGALYFALHFFASDAEIDLSRVSTLTTFLYGFFTFSFLSYIQTKFINFKEASGDFLIELKSFYLLAKTTGQEKCVQASREAIKTLLDQIYGLSPNDYRLDTDKLKSLYTALDTLKAEDSKASNYHFSMLLRATAITNLVSKIHTYGRRYLTGELKFMFLLFTVLFVAVMGTLAMQNLVSLISAIILVVIVTFSVFYIFHLDGFTLSEQTILNDKIANLLDYIEDKK